MCFLLPDPVYTFLFIRLAMGPNSVQPRVFGLVPHRFCSALGEGRRYLYKAVLHLLLSPHIDQLIMLDTDTLFVRPLSEL